MRFNAFDDLFSIQKKDDESLIDTSVRIDKAVAHILNLAPKDGYTADLLIEELRCMAYIRALPEQFASLSTSLLLLDKVDKDTILHAFRAEEMNRTRRVEMANRVQVRPQSQQRRMICYNCQEEGHMSYNCTKPKKQRVRSEVQRSNKAEERNGIKKIETKTEEVIESAGNVSTSDENAFVTWTNTLGWNTDSGATSHMTPHYNWLRNYVPCKVPIRLADNTVVYSEGVGTVLFKPIVNGKPGREVEFTKVLHVPALRNNLFSVLYLTL